MEYEFIRAELPAQPIVSIRERTTIAGMPALVAKGLAALFRFVGGSGAAAIGEPFVIYHDVAANGVDAEVCVPVGTPLPVDDRGRISSRILPPATVIRTTHVGRYEELGAAYDAVRDWLVAHGLVMSGPPRETYLNDPREVQTPAEYRTRIDQPVAEPDARQVA